MEKPDENRSNEAPTRRTDERSDGKKKPLGPLTRRSYRCVRVIWCHGGLRRSLHRHPDPFAAVTDETHSQSRRRSGEPPPPSHIAAAPRICRGSAAHRLRPPAPPIVFARLRRPPSGRGCERPPRVVAVCVSEACECSSASPCRVRRPPSGRECERPPRVVAVCVSEACECSSASPCRRSIGGMSGDGHVPAAAASAGHNSRGGDERIHQLEVDANHRPLLRLRGHHRFTKGTQTISPFFDFTPSSFPMASVFSALSDPTKLFNDLGWNFSRPLGFKAVNFWTVQFLCQARNLKITSSLYLSVYECSCMKLHNQVLLDLVILSSEFLYIRLHC